MLTNKNTTTYRLKEETNAMGAAQIMLGLIHNALATLWISLYHVEDKKYSIGSKLMLVSICYLLVSGALRIIAIIANTLSIFAALFGAALFGYEFPLFESMGIEYIWSNMAGMMLLQISVLCTISELIIAITVLHWFMSSRKNKVPSNEIFLVFSEPPPSKPPSLLDLENVSEDSPKKIEDEIDVTN
uniref:Membrane-spanning 4-domains, subfamily A, member 20 n=1 Tax=Rattus norvegicus TaxID=10116 RepID=A0ABK0LGF6_RAT